MSGWSRILAVLILGCAPWPLVLAGEWHFSSVDRVVAVGDVHGAYDALVDTLQAAGVIDAELAWTGGRTHLVSTGDLLDRGPESRRVMDLMMRLETESRLAGGRVHQLLGNHEVMNLIGDLRYVADEEYAAFIDGETAAEREFWYRRFLDSRPAGSAESTARSEFDDLAPPGFFGHRRAFRRDGKYGAWLLQKPFMVVINETLFVHGGVPPYVTAHGLAGVNGVLKQDLVGYVTRVEVLEDQRVLSPVDRFKARPAMLEEKLLAKGLQADTRHSIERLLELGRSPLHGPAGPTWYRGTAACNRLVEGDALLAAFAKVGAKRVVVGHTTTTTRQVQQRADGRVVEIDTGMLKETYEGSGNALVIAGDNLTVVSQDGESVCAPIAHPVRVGHESLAIDDAALANVLAAGDVVEMSSVAGTWKLLQVTGGDTTVFALFRPSPEDGRFAPELAAYRLDRALQLGMVPVTVRREVAGVRGTLQFLPENAVTERTRVVRGEGQRAPCSLPKQMGAMRVFDRLIHNPARSPASILYDPDDWLLILTDHEQSFGKDSEPSVYPGDAEFGTGDEWRAALRELDDETLAAFLGDVLDEDRLIALRDRRDALLRTRLEP